ncbi:MAG TPA: nitroreductase/quinone reductase family protein [Methylomirabilota bacterium]|jgi:deazaflavin-dependent oxidoreductase (nitroreductase family)|nr:nitroreductase/quinone reductase family protein [Methylomirabilota bacterium]
MSLNLDKFVDLDYCYLTTTGRVTGRPHTIEIWFAAHGQTLYFLSGDKEQADWVKNFKKTPQVTVRLNRSYFAGHARIVTDKKEAALARKLLFTKYQPRYHDDLTSWRRTALPVAIDLSARL